MCVELYRWSIELEGIFVLPLAPRWVRHSYLSRKATIDPLYLWVIKTFFWRRCRGVIAWGEYSRVCLFALSLSNLFVVLSCFLSLVMGRKCKIPKKLVVPTTPMVEEPLKIYHTPEAYYLDHLRSLCARAETPTSLVEGKSLDEHAYYV